MFTRTKTVLNAGDNVDSCIPAQLMQEFTLEFAQKFAKYWAGGNNGQHRGMGEKIGERREIKIKRKGGRGRKEDLKKE